jgi:hypothetical protein
LLAENRPLVLPFFHHFILLSQPRHVWHLHELNKIRRDLMNSTIAQDINPIRNTFDLVLSTFSLRTFFSLCCILKNPWCEWCARFERLLATLLVHQNSFPSHTDWIVFITSARPRPIAAPPQTVAGAWCAPQARLLTGDPWSPWQRGRRACTCPPDAHSPSQPTPHPRTRSTLVQRCGGGA